MNTSKKLYEKLSKRDYSNNATDQYAQLLRTIFIQATLHNEIEKFYILLQKATKENKKIAVKELLDEIFISDLILI